MTDLKVLSGARLVGTLVKCDDESLTIEEKQLDKYKKIMRAFFRQNGRFDAALIKMIDRKPVPIGIFILNVRKQFGDRYKYFQPLTTRYMSKESDSDAGSIITMEDLPGVYNMTATIDEIDPDTISDDKPWQRVGRENRSERGRGGFRGRGRGRGRGGFRHNDIRDIVAKAVAEAIKKQDD